MKLFSVRRRLAAVTVAGALSALAFGGVASAQDRFDISGTIHSIDGSRIIVITSDFTGKPQPLTIDISQIRRFEPSVGTPVSLRIYSRENDTYLAREVIAESPYVNRLEFGVREEFTVRQSSIQAGVGNVPEDDEALNKQHRTNDLRHRNNNDDDDDHDNEDHDKNK